MGTTTKVLRLCRGLCLLAVVSAPNTYHSTEAIWQHTKRCDMLDAKTTFLKGFHQKTDYTQGRWVVAGSMRPSTAAMPLTSMECDRTHDPCPLGSCFAAPAAAGFAELCRDFSDKCFGRTHHGELHDRPEYSVYAQFVVGAHGWVWEPSDGCHFSPIVTEANAEQWKGWASGLEASAGPSLWVGDTLLAEHYLAFAGLTGGAVRSDFVRSDVLVNTWTLAPMTASQVSACELSNGASSGEASVPCPPIARHSSRWQEDNSAHQLRHMRWTREFEAKAGRLNTLILGVGSEWWRQHDYPSAANGCRTANGVSDAFAPLSLLGLLAHDQFYRTCDVFDVKFREMAANVAKYVHSVASFRGKVVFVTSPSGVKGCSASARFPLESVLGGGANGGAAAMMAKPTADQRREEQPSRRAFFFESNPQGAVLPPDASGAFHHFGRLRSAERLWAHAFSKHAPRLKTATLNISSVSDGRADVIARSDGECAHFCFPGLPHTWAEMLLRVLEQMTYGATDGLY